MADFTDGYATGYLYLTHVYDGTYIPQDAGASAAGPFTGVKYRVVGDTKEDTDPDGVNGGTLRKIREFEIWTITLDSGAYEPKPNDLFKDVDGKTWSVIDSEHGDLRTSSRMPVTISLFCRRKQ